MESGNQSSFWQFSDNLRHETGGLANLSLNDSIWSVNNPAKRKPEERRNFDFRGEDSVSQIGGSARDLKSGFNIELNSDIWKAPINREASRRNPDEFRRFGFFSEESGSPFGGAARDPNSDFGAELNSDIRKAPINRAVGRRNTEQRRHFDFLVEDSDSPFGGAASDLKLDLNSDIRKAQINRAVGHRNPEERRHFDFLAEDSDSPFDGHASVLKSDLKTDTWKAPINLAVGHRNPEERRNYDFLVEGSGSPFGGPARDLKRNFNTELNNDIWKAPINDVIAHAVDYSGIGSGSAGLNGGFNKGIYSGPSLNFNGYNNGRVFAKNFMAYGKLSKGKNEEDLGKFGKKSKGHRDSAKDNAGNKNGGAKSEVEKRFKSLPPAEALPRNEIIGGYIFVCNNDTMAENLKRQLFGLPSRFRDSVRAIQPGLPLFLYNYSTHQLHGIFEATSFGGTNIDPTAWEDKKNPGESRFPAQVRVKTLKICEPLEEDSFRPILHHYDGPKFRLELNVPEALSLLDILKENSS